MATAPPTSEPEAAPRHLLDEGVVPAQAWPNMTEAKRRHVVMSLLQDPLEVGVGEEDERLRLHANTCLYAQRWEAWEADDRCDRSQVRNGGTLPLY